MVDGEGLADLLDRLVRYLHLPSGYNLFVYDHGSVGQGGLPLGASVEVSSFRLRQRFNPLPIRGHLDCRRSSTV